MANIEKRTGKSLTELTAIVKNSGLSKHGEMVAMLKSTLGLGHGDANTLVHFALKSDGKCAAQGLSEGQVLDGLYTAKARSANRQALVAMQNSGLRSGTEDLRQLSSQEAVRHDRPCHEYAGRGRAQREGTENDRPPAGTAGRADV
jgi:hypothetical protein